LCDVVASEVGDDYKRSGHTQSKAEEAAKAVFISMGSFNMAGAEVYRREFIDGVLYSFVRFPYSGEAKERIASLIREGLRNKEAESNQLGAEKDWDRLEKAVLDSLPQKMGGLR
jgi:hypothetical protein